jgi:hypothetical protein
MIELISVGVVQEIHVITILDVVDQPLIFDEGWVVHRSEGLQVEVRTSTVCAGVVILHS